jgi:hypothetical protein
MLRHWNTRRCGGIFKGPCSTIPWPHTARTRISGLSAGRWTCILHRYRISPEYWLANPGCRCGLQAHIVFSGYIHHDCASVEDIWRLALEKNSKPLCEFQARALRKTFGPPSQKQPQGESLNWLAEKWYQLKEQYPDLIVAEWSTGGHDERIYRSNLGRAGFDTQKVLPDPSSWLCALPCWKHSLPSLIVHSLPYVCSLFAPSDLVWHAHDAVIDSLMLYDITATREKKVHNGTTTVPQPPESLQRLFRRLESNAAGSVFHWSCPWTLEEEQHCFELLASEHEKALRSSVYDLALRTSFQLAKRTTFYRTGASILRRWDERIRQMRSESEFTKFGAMSYDHAKKMLELRQQIEKENRLASIRGENIGIAVGRTRFDEFYAMLDYPALGLARRIVKDIASEIGRVVQCREFLVPDRAFWRECRRRALKQISMNDELSAADMNLAVLIESQRPIKCGQPDCKNLVWRYKGTYCSTCWIRLTNTMCQIVGCGNKRLGRAMYCHACWARIKHKSCWTVGCEKNPRSSTYCKICWDRVKNRNCQAVGCGNKSGAATYCPKCYRQTKEAICQFVGCGRTTRASTYCSRCWDWVKSKTCQTVGYGNKSGAKTFCPRCYRQSKQSHLSNCRM